MHVSDAGLVSLSRRSDTPIYSVQSATCLLFCSPPPPFFLLQESAIADLTNTVRSLETQRTNTLDADLASSSQSQISRLATRLSEQEAAIAGLTSTVSNFDAQDQMRSIDWSAISGTVDTVNKLQVRL